MHCGWCVGECICSAQKWDKWDARFGGSWNYLAARHLRRPYPSAAPGHLVAASWAMASPQ